MELKHTINGIEILEPIGFDGLKTTIKRHDYHGMSAEVSVGTLEFSGEAASIIHDAYNTDIDTELNYVVTDEYGTVIYTGMIDLSTYDEHSGDYFTVSCKVGEVGVKTIFNNRTSTEVDLNATKTIDGDSFAHIPLWRNNTIPFKTIRYINEHKQLTSTTYTQEPATGNELILPDDFSYAWLNLALDTAGRNEFGSMQPLFHMAKTQEYANVIGYADPFYSGGNTAADGESLITIEVLFNMSIVFTSPPFTNQNGTKRLDIYPIVNFNGNNRQLPGPIKGTQITNDNYSTPQNIYHARSYTVKMSELNSLYVGLEFDNQNGGLNNPAGFKLTINEGSYIRMRLDSQAKDMVKAETILVHEALNKITESISNNQLTVKSDLYSRCDSVVNARPYQSPFFGDGALKAITNGYKIRGLYSDATNERNMPLSFKNMIEALDAIDCIGWGFSQEGEQLYIRVENWEWFYQNKPLLTINDAKEKQRKVNNDLVITELNIGYKKYTTAEDVSSIDNIHSERTFTTTTKAITKSQSKLCNFIADNYAIEETRRAALFKDAGEEFKYDENIFIFALAGRPAGAGKFANYFIPADIVANSSSLLNTPSEVYNAKISPMRNAFRWINRLFCLSGLKPFKLTKGTVNYLAAFKTLSNGEWVYLPDHMNDIPVLEESTSGGVKYDPQNAENTPLCETYHEASPHCTHQGDYNIPRVIKAEELIIKYPITFSQYKAIMANPYGIITVDGEECWLKEMTYSFFKDEAELKLIPKAN